METTLARLGALAPQLHAGQAARAGRAPDDHVAGAGIAREKFEEIARLNRRRIYRVVLGLVRDADAAETLTQECFLRAYQKRNSFRRESSVGTWLVRIAVNLAIDHVGNRRNAFWRLLFGGAKPDAVALAAKELPDPRASPERQFAAREQLQAVWSVVNGLSPQQRATFLLRFGEEMTLEEVAETMALEVGTVKAHLARAVGAVRKRLKESRPHARTSDR